MTDVASPWVSVPAPAKLNLMLHITGRRPDGYHNLQTLFQFLDYSDWLEFRCRGDDLLTLTPDIDGVERESNLIIRAARVLQNLAKEKGITVPGADIRLTKRLPMGGGLGGGSSDAATTLLTLNKIWQLGQSLDQLARIGLGLGADVPVFIYGQAAFAEGVGEQLTPVPQLEEKWFLVVRPDVHVNTAEIFSHKCLTRNTPAINMRTALEQGGDNDCQQIVSMIYPEVGNALNLLNKYSLAKMTGTGACIFSSFDSEAAAAKVAEQLPAEYEHFIAQGVNHSPAHTLLFRPS
tara:strand:+ start:5067 stop:5942 length:876 start_codon:yes stop_codon:yes gene_type:complete